MPTTPINSGSIIRDSIFFVKDFISGAIADPLTNRPTNHKFIMTAYPQLPTVYPLITIKPMNIAALRPLGLQSEAIDTDITIEVRAWGRDTRERDEMADRIFNQLRTNWIGTGSEAQAYDLHDFKMLSSVNVDEEKVKSKVMTFQWRFISI